MFDRVTEQVRTVFVLANKEATSNDSQTLETQHLLVGLIRESSGIAAKILQSLNVSAPKVAKLAANKEFLTPETPSPNSKGFSRETRIVAQLALSEAVSLEKNNVDTEHLLMGLMRNETNASRILNELGVDSQQVYEKVKAYATAEARRLATNNETKNASAGGTAVAETVGGDTASPAPGQGSSILDRYGKNLTRIAKEKKLDPVIGRENETRRVMQTLSRKMKNNAILVGEPGVGKSAIVEGLAQNIVSGNVPTALKGKQIYVLDISLLIAGAKFRGEFEERLGKVIAEATSNKSIILFIDEIHTIIGAGGEGGGVDAANILKPALSRGEIQTIGATTTDEYRKYFEKDKALARRFQQVVVKEPTAEETITILEGLRKHYEEFHNVEITDEAIEAAVNLSSRYMRDKQLPDKAIDLIDETSADLKLGYKDYTDEITTYARETELLREEITALREDTGTSNETRSEQLAELKKMLSKVTRKTQRTMKKLAEQRGVITSALIADTISEHTGVPASKMTADENKKLLAMERIISNRVVGQGQAVKAMTKTIRRQRTGLRDPNRPAGSFIFAGPTGVGKTEAARALAEFLFDDERKLITFDMSEYSEKHTVSGLIGTTAGYVGYGEGGRLTNQVRQNPFSVVLFDEIEKAHPDVFNTFLQILEEGRLTDGAGKEVDFRNTIIIMTTNLGAREMSANTLGFQMSEEDGNDYKAMESKVKSALKENFRPEFLNRLDDILVFPHLTKTEVGQIVDVMIRKLNTRLITSGYSIEIAQTAKDALVEDGYDKTLGARPLRRAITKNIEEPLSERILIGDLPSEGVVNVDYVDGEFTFDGMSACVIEGMVNSAPVHL